MSLFLRVAVAAIILSIPCAAVAAWHEARSNHFIVYADLKPAELRAYAERLERFDQAVRSVRGMDDPALTDSQRLTVYALRSERAVSRLAGSSAARGFYNARLSGASAFVPRRTDLDGFDWALDTQEIFFHEYAHHLQLQFSTYALPAWVIEGFAEFFATAKLEKNGSVVIGHPPQYRAYGLFNLTGLKLEDLLGGTYGRLNDDQTELLYGKGWLLTHYLTFEPRRKGQLADYANSIQRGDSAIASARSAFGDLKALDRELNAYMRGKLSGVRVKAERLSVGPIAIRALGAGEAAIMDIHIRSRSGVDEKTAPAVAADARKAATPYPNDPFVQSAVAEAEYDAGNFAEAEVAADRALAANPNYVRALIYKGRARMGLATADTGKADWKAIRGIFARANRLDTENAEPLMLFYESYLYSGERPTKNAIEGLLYAVALAPQDNELRVNAVRQMLLDSRFDDARKLFSVLAFRPHAPEKYRESNAKIMAAIAARDDKSALSALEAAMNADEREEQERR